MNKYFLIKASRTPNVFTTPFCLLSWCCDTLIGDFVLKDIFWGIAHRHLSLNSSS